MKSDAGSFKVGSFNINRRRFLKSTASMAAFPA
jgi:hypothetical protein